MKKPLLMIVAVVLLSSCAPVLRQELMKTAVTGIPFARVRDDPGLYKGRLFILGGKIVNTKVTQKGSLIEAVYIPVDSWGYLRGMERANGRFLAIYPKEQGILDPLIYSQGRKVSLAAELIGTRTGKIGEMEYIFPLFEIKDLHLWAERKIYYAPPPRGLWYYSDPYWDPYWWDDPWWRFYYQRYHYRHHPSRRR